MLRNLMTGVCAVLWLGASPAVQAQPADGWVGQIKVARGITQLERGGQRFPAPVGLRLKQNDVLLTAANGALGVMFNDNSTLSMGPNAEVLLERYAYDSTTYMGAFDAYVKRGAVSIEAGNLATADGEAVIVRTPQAELRARTRNFAVHVEGQ